MIWSEAPEGEPQRRRGDSPIFRLENPHGQRSLAGCSPWGRKEWDRLPTPVFLGFPGGQLIEKRLHSRTISASQPLDQHLSEV